MSVVWQLAVEWHHIKSNVVWWPYVVESAPGFINNLGNPTRVHTSFELVVMLTVSTWDKRLFSEASLRWGWPRLRAHGLLPNNLHHRLALWQGHVSLPLPTAAIDSRRRFCNCQSKYILCRDWSIKTKKDENLTTNKKSTISELLSWNLVKKTTLLA